MGIIYITRHGETEWNAEGRIQGHTDVPLSERGREQARMLARRLADVRIDAAYSSDLSRAAETATTALGERDVPLRLTAELREYNKGVFEGLTAQEYREAYPDLYDASMENDLDFAPPDGETIRQTSVRLGGIFQKVRLDHMDETVLIVGHGGSLRAGIVSLLDLPLEANWKFVMHNCSLTVVRTYPDNCVMHLYNDTSHITGITRAFGG
jgi:broad specificity phosphatase PhoE